MPVLVIPILLVKVVKKPSGDQQPNHNICWSSQLANLHKQADRLLNPLVMEPKHPIGFPHGRPLKEVWEKEF